MAGSESKKAKEQLTTGYTPDGESTLQNEQRYRLTLDNLLEGCQIIDFDWRYFYINAAAANHGRKKQDELLHHIMMEIYPDIEKTELFAVIRDSMQNRVAHHLENEFIFPEGDAGWFELSIQPVPEGIFILSIDITTRKKAESDRKRIEESIIRSQEHLNTVVEIEHSLATYLNQEKIYEILTKGVFKLFPDIETVLISSFDSNLQKIKAVYGSIDGDLVDVTELPELPLAPEGQGTQSQVIHTRQPLIINKNLEDQLHQSLVYVGSSKKTTQSALFVPMLGLNKVLGLVQLQSFSPDRFNDEDARMLALVANTAAVSIQNARLFESAQREIVDRKRAEEALNSSLSLLQIIIDTTPVRIFWKDRDSNYLGCNPAFAKDVGFDNPADIIGKDDYQLSSKIQADQYRADDQRVMNSGISKISYEEMQTSPNGSLLWLRTSKVPLRNNENQIIGILGVYEDITERKQTNEALVNSENQLTTAIQIAHLGYWEYDIKEDLFTFNDQFYSMLRTSASQVGGYTMSSEEYSRRFVHPEDSAAVGNEIQLAVETADPKYTRLIEHRIIYGDGQIGYVTVHFFIVKDGHGRTVKTYGVNQDISNRKQTEIALRASEENYRSLIENAESAIAVLDQEGKILFANPTGIKIWNDPQIVGKTIFHIYPRQYAQRYSIAIKKIIDTGVGIVDDVESLINDRLMWFRLSMSPLKNSYGVVNSILLNAWDITDRKKTEEELQFRNILLSTQQEASIDGILVVGDKDQVLSYNRQFEAMMGIHVRLVEGQEDEPILHHIMDKVIDPQSFLNQVQHIYQHRQETSRDEMTLTDGRVFDRYSAPMFGSDDRYFGRIWYFRDITQHKQAEREIQQRNDDLLLIQALNDADSQGDGIEAVADVFAKGASQLFSCQAVAVYLLSSDGKYLEMRSSTLPIKLKDLVERLIGQTIPKIRIPIREDSYLHQILMNEQGTLCNDPIEIQQWIMEFTETTFLPSAVRPLLKRVVPQIFSTLNIQSTISMPLISSGQTIGLIDLSSQGEFSEMDIHRLRNISNQMTAVILRKIAESQVRLQLKRLSALTEIDRAITSSLDMRLSLDILLSVVQSQLGVDATAILLFNAFTQKLEYIAGRGFRTSAMRQSQIHLGEGIAGRVGIERKIMHIPDLREIGKQFVRAELLKKKNLLNITAFHWWLRV